MRIFSSALIFKTLRKELFGVYQFYIINEGGNDSYNISFYLKSKSISK